MRKSKLALSLCVQKKFNMCKTFTYVCRYMLVLSAIQVYARRGSSVLPGSGDHPTSTPPRSRSYSMLWKATPLPPFPPKPQYYSISTLFAKLTNPPDPHYPATFLLTYRMFTNGHEVLDTLIEGHRRELTSRKGTEVRSDGNTFTANLHSSIRKMTLAKISYNNKQ